MVRVCLCLGSWQLIVLAAALHDARQNTARNTSDNDAEDYLVLYGFGRGAEADRALLKHLEEVAPNLWPWKRIIVVGDMLSSGLDSGCVSPNANALVERVGVRTADEVWVCKVGSKPEKLACHAYADARIVLYEDGLGTYDTQIGEVKPPTIREVVRRAYRHGLVEALACLGMGPQKAAYQVCEYGLTQDVMARLSRLALVLADQIPVPPALQEYPVVPITTASLRIMAERYALSLGLERSHTDTGTPDTVLVLGQNFSDYRLLTREEELGVYSQIVREVIASGKKVLWKDHPRCSQPFFPELESAHTGKVSALSVTHLTPVEVAVAGEKLSACIAGTSSAIFYLPRLYDVPAYSFAGRFVSQHPVLAEMVRQCIDLVPDLSKMGMLTVNPEPLHQGSS